MPGGTPQSIRRSTSSQTSAWLMAPNSSLSTQPRDSIVHLSLATITHVESAGTMARCRCPAVQFPLWKGNWPSSSGSFVSFVYPNGLPLWKVSSNCCGGIVWVPPSQPVLSLQLLPLCPPDQDQSHQATFQHGASLYFYNHATSAHIL